MAHALTISGVSGQVKWLYAVAAEIAGYRVTRSAGQWMLSGTVTRADPFRLSQRPLVFVAPHAKGEWRWPIRECQIKADELTAELDPPVR